MLSQKYSIKAYDHCKAYCQIKEQIANGYKNGSIG